MFTSELNEKFSNRFRSVLNRIQQTTESGRNAICKRREIGYTNFNLVCEGSCQNLPTLSGLCLSHRVLLLNVFRITGTQYKVQMKFFSILLSLCRVIFKKIKFSSGSQFSQSTWCKVIYSSSSTRSQLYFARDTCYSNEKASKRFAQTLLSPLPIKTSINYNYRHSIKKLIKCNILLDDIDLQAISHSHT